MKNSAPVWPLAGGLTLIAISAAIFILGGIDIIPLERITFGNECGEYSSVAFNPLSVYVSILSLCFWPVVFVAGCVKKWHWLFLTGVALLFAEAVVGLIDLVRLQSLSDIAEMRDYQSSGMMTAMVGMAASVAGDILVACKSKISKRLRAVIILFVVVFSLLQILHFPTMAWVIAIFTVKMSGAVVLAWFCLRRNQNKNKYDETQCI